MRILPRGGIIAAVAVIGVLVSGGAANAVIGGKVATHPGSRAAVEIGGSSRCTGSVVAFQQDEPAEWVLTSGDCAALAQTAAAEVVVGSVDRTADCSAKGSRCKRVGIAGSFVDPRYIESEGMTPAYDVGLIRLATPVRVQAIRVPRWTDAVGDVGTLAGWGTTCRDLTPACDVRPALMRTLRMQFVGAAKCDLGDLPSGEPVVDPRYVACVAATKNREAMGCIGDSGALLRAAILVGDGDDLEPRVNDCNTSPRGGQGTGLAVRIAPSHQWIVSTMRDPDAAGAAASAKTLSAGTPRWQQYTLAG